MLWSTSSLLGHVKVSVDNLITSGVQPLSIAFSSAPVHLIRVCLCRSYFPSGWRVDIKPNFINIVRNFFS